MSTEQTKLIIASDGDRTAVVLDGVLLGKGVERIDFSTDSETGKAVIRMMDIDVSHLEIDTKPDLKNILKKAKSKDE